MTKIILASKSNVRKKILEKNNISCIAVPSNVDEDQVKESLLAVGANPMLISNGSVHFLITSVCISKNGAMVWNFTDQSELKMKTLSDGQLNNYLKKIKTKTLLAYGVYQIEAGGLELFSSVKGNMDSIMGLPIRQVMDYIRLKS